jgi:1,4-dihydroxy-6-naphthoate synthase
MNLTIGYSPCPNDCFVFDALVNKKIDTEGLNFEVILEDIETLNKKALEGHLDITKLSFHAYVYNLKQYILLRAGSALGFNCGPILVKSIKSKIKNLDDISVAIPGKLTTANFLLSLAYPNLKNKIEYTFSDIEEAVLKGKVDAGLIIHENRFTYHEKGLVKIIDLGEYWNSLIQAPIPLGGIVIKRHLDKDLQQKVNKLIKKSVEFAFQNPESSMQYVKQNAQEMNEEVMKKHINLYVNSFSLDLGDIGINAVELMFNKGKELKLFDFETNQLIID